MSFTNQKGKKCGIGIVLRKRYCGKEVRAGTEVYLEQEGQEKREKPRSGLIRR